MSNFVEINCTETPYYFTDSWFDLDTKMQLTFKSVGIVLNSLLILVLFRDPTFQKSASFRYHKAIAILELYECIISFYWKLARHLDVPTYAYCWGLEAQFMNGSK